MIPSGQAEPRPESRRSPEVLLIDRFEPGFERSVERPVPADRAKGHPRRASVDPPEIEGLQVGGFASAEAGLPPPPPPSESAKAPGVNVRSGSNAWASEVTAVSATRQTVLARSRRQPALVIEPGSLNTLSFDLPTHACVGAHASSCQSWHNAQRVQRECGSACCGSSPTSSPGAPSRGAAVELPILVRSASQGHNHLTRRRVRR